MMNTMRALIISPDEALTEHLESRLTEAAFTVVKEQEWKEESFQQGYSVAFVDDLFLKDQSSLWTPGNMYVIAITKERSFDAARAYMKLGVYDVIVIEEESERLHDLVYHLKEKVERGEFSAATSDSYQAQGEVLSFYSSKGGSGKTLLSTMTAQCLKGKHKKSVVMIDLNAQFGGLDVTFGLEHNRSYYDLKPVLDELAIHHVQNVAVTHEQTGIDVILGPSNPEQAEELEDELVSRLIRVCKEHYDYVIVDMPTGVSALSFMGLNEASHIYYVLNPDSMSLRVLKHTLSLFDRFQLGKKQGLSLILNRTDKKDEMTEADVKKIVEVPVGAVIRSDYFGLQPLLNMGMPFFLNNGKKAKTKVTKDVERFVEKSVVS
ncbi:AAA family ATPase [Alteribacter aurantiacus]|uniref:AAA family ATPase n=1 Tax=Alteribacter aurantiacus TaxID=254410 RepID=UPI00040C3A28|nr:AAA family ATPase [Alteribacter aurantiacus]